MKKRTYPVVSLLYMLLCIFILLHLGRSMYYSWARRDIVLDRKNALNVVEQENIRLKKELEDAQSEAFIESEARNKLGLVKPGEYIVLFPSSEATPSGIQTELQEPNWKLWMKLFF